MILYVILDSRSSELSLLDVGLPASSQTVFTPPPESMVGPDGKEMTFAYGEFPRKLNPTYFQLEKLSRFCKRNLESESEPPTGC